MGDVLVYRHPGLHFGDIHVLKAVYKEEMEGFIGNSRHAIFFSTRGSSSAAYEMATGDFDGDLYWISWNPEVCIFILRTRMTDYLYVYCLTDALILRVLYSCMHVFC